jgi:anti-sigma regulatory factor (Ser/Thr protein kinase)
MALPTRPAHPKLGSGDQRLRFAIGGGPRAPERARAGLQNRVSWVTDETRKQVLLLASELVNNAVRHGGADEGDLLSIAVWPTDDGVGVEVTDSGNGFTPTGRNAPLEEPGGWGLVLVETMSTRWGVTRDDRTRVWFELAAERA